jgi:hypothetical protein
MIVCRDRTRLRPIRMLSVRIFIVGRRFNVRSCSGYCSSLTARELLLSLLSAGLLFLMFLKRSTGCHGTSFERKNHHATDETWRTARRLTACLSARLPAGLLKATTPAAAATKSLAASAPRGIGLRARFVDAQRSAMQIASVQM